MQSQTISQNSQNSQFTRLVPAVRLTAIPCHPKGIAILEENYFLRLIKLKTALAIVSGCGGQPGMYIAGSTG